MECWILHALNARSFACIVEEGQGYQVMALDEKKKIQGSLRHSNGHDILQMSFLCLAHVL